MKTRIQNPTLMTTKTLATVSACWAVLTGCHAKTAVAPKEAIEAAPLETVELSSYEQEPMRLGDVKMFLWRDGTTPDQVEEVLDSSSTVETIEKELPSLKVEYQDVQTKMNVADRQTDVQKRKDDANAEWSNTSAEIYQKTEKDQKALDRYQQLGDKYQAEYNEISRQLTVEQAKPKPSVAVVNKLKKDLKGYDDPKTGKLTKNNERIKELKESLANAEVEIVPLRQKLRDIEDRIKGCDDEFAEIQRVKDQYEPILKPIKEKYELRQQQYIDAVNRLSAVVDWFNEKPDAFTFAVDKNGQPSVTVSKWDVLDGSGMKSFSSEESTIANVSYNARGAVFKFDIQTATGAKAVDPATQEEFSFDETYAFKVSRAKDREGDSRKFFQGDIIRTRKMTLVDGRTLKEVRRGSIKLATE